MSNAPDRFPDAELLAIHPDRDYWDRVRLLADLSNLENSTRELLRALRETTNAIQQDSAQQGERLREAGMRLVHGVSEVEEYLGAVTDKAGVSRRHIDLVLAMARRTADKLAVGMAIEPLSDDRLDELLAHVQQDIRDATEALPFRLEETEDGQLMLRECQQRGCGVGEPLADAYLSATQLADCFRVPQGPLECRLRRWRRKNAAGDSWIEHDKPAQNEPRYLYRLNAVRGVIDSLKSATDSDGRATDGKDLKG